MLSSPSSLIGKGVYTLPEAEKITGIPKLRIRRWMEGYTFTSSGKKRRSEPIIQSVIGREFGELALTFSDLIEVRFLDAFLQHGVSWHTVRIAADRARDLILKSHPFSTRIFKTDGTNILAEIVRKGNVPDLLNLVKNQYEIQKVVSPMLYAGVEFNDFDEPSRWWPLTKKKSVVIDPARAFGAPIVAAGGVRTSILAASAKAERSQKMTALLFNVPTRAVRHAVEYESRLSA